jgi:hypothetical protein
MAKVKPLIDRAAFQPRQFGGVEGAFTLDGVRFECCVKSADGDVERAWANAERLVDLILNRFTSIEHRVRSDLAPSLDAWTEEKLSLAELTRRTTAAMLASESVALNVSDSLSAAFFEGPDIVLDHVVCVRVDGAGRIIAVGLA